jgi:hypothetical protein
MKERKFDIRKAAAGKSFVVVKKLYVVSVVKNFLEIHLFCAGKGTCCITQGYCLVWACNIGFGPNYEPKLLN